MFFNHNMKFRFIWNIEMHNAFCKSKFYQTQVFRLLDSLDKLIDDISEEEGPTKSLYKLGKLLSGDLRR